MWIKNIHDRSLFLQLSTHYFCGRSKREFSCLEIRSSSRFLLEIWISDFAQRILEGVYVGGIVNIRNECLFILGSWEMNRSAEQTNRTRTASRFTRFVCSALRFISHEPRKKDTQSLNILLRSSTLCSIKCIKSIMVGACVTLDLAITNLKKKQGSCSLRCPWAARGQPTFHFLLEQRQYRWVYMRDVISRRLPFGKPLMLHQEPIPEALLYCCNLVFETPGADKVRKIYCLA